MSENPGVLIAAEFMKKHSFRIMDEEEYTKRMEMLEYQHTGRLSSVPELKNERARKQSPNEIRADARAAFGLD